MKNRVPRLSALALLASFANPVQAQIIDTGPVTLHVSSFGPPSTTTVGQTFRALTGYDRLDQFTFQFRQDSNGQNLTFQAFLYAWDGQKATGNALYTSTLRMGTGSATYTTYTFTTGGVSVVGGQAYVAFVNASDFVANTGGDARMEVAATQSTYTDGTAVFLNNGPDFAAVTQTTWDRLNTVDLAFTASFSGAVVPEPSSAALVIAGLAALSLSAYRRRVA